MPRYIGLLRGVNVGGNNKVSMPQLRTMLTSLGHSDVSTYIQSGNVIFTSGEKVSERSLETAIASTFGIEIAVMLRTAAELERVLSANPFGGAEVSTVHVGFLKEEPPAPVVASLDPQPFKPDRFVIKGTELYVQLPNGLGRSKLLPYLSRRLKIPTTVRSWRTVVKLVELTS